MLKVSAILSVLAVLGSFVICHAATHTEFTRLLDSEGQADDHFGISVGLAGSKAIVGAPGDDSRIGPYHRSGGSVFVFDVESGTQLSNFRASDTGGGDAFGHSIAVDGNIALIGAIGDDDKGVESGSAYLFDISTGEQLHKLLADDGASHDQFGRSVALDNSKALIGAYLADNSGISTGSAYLFDTVTGQQLKKFSPPDGGSSDLFGVSVALDGNRALIGAHGEDHYGPASGAAYLFDVTSGELLSKFTPDDGAALDTFGFSVALSGNWALIGSKGNDEYGNSSGAAYLFDVISGEQLAKLTPSDAGDFDSFGYSVAIRDNVALVGTFQGRVNGTRSGSAYLFDLVSGVQLAKLVASDGATGDFFGSFTDFADRGVIIGAYGRDGNGPNSGAVYLYGVSSIPEPNAASLVSSLLFSLVLIELGRRRRR